MIYEEHCSVLSDWVTRGYQDKTLVYVDAHLDLQFVSEPRMNRLREGARNKDIAGLEKPSHLLPDGDYVFGLENFLYPAARLGVIDHLIWVTPPHVDIHLTPESLEFVQQMDGVTFEELTNSRRTGAQCYELTLLGLRITICDIATLATLSIPDDALVDIDTDFFAEVPGDRAWMDPADLHAALASRVPSPALVSIARSVGSGFMPLRYRYFADYLAALFADDTQSAGHYRRLYDIEHATRDPRGRASAIAAECDAFPKCPATLPLRDRLAGAETSRGAAAELDPAYRDDPVRLASAVTNRRLALNKAQIDALRERFIACDDALPAEGYVALGLAYAAIGDLGNAIECYDAYGRPHPQLALDIAGLMAGRDDDGRRSGLLEIALADDKCKTSALMQLGELAARRGDLDDARRYFEHAHSLAPAWLEPLGHLGWLHDKQCAAQANPYQQELQRRIAALRRLLAA